MTKSDNEPRWHSPEFLLVLVMLVVLLFIVLLVLFAPLPETTVAIDVAMVLDYRKSLLSVIITAFGAWVGAGAAYYFGRENLREASQSLLKMREPTPQERLQRTSIKDVPPRQIDWIVKMDDKVEGVFNHLKEKPSHWFIPIIEKDTLRTIISDEAVYRFISDNVASEKPWSDIKEKKVSEVIKFLADPSNRELRERSEDIFVKASLGDSAAEINDSMSSKNVKLAIITDDQGKPVQFITTADVRRVLLRAK